MTKFDQTRRSFLSGVAGSAGLFFAGGGAAGAARGDDGLDGVADVTLRIAPVQLEVAPGRMIEAVCYNVQVPGPVLRFREGAVASVDLINDTSAGHLVHWLVLETPTDVDGSGGEEGNLAVRRT